MFRGRDSGFTLVELVVVIVLFALVASVLSAAVAVILRNESNTEGRSDDARSLRGLETWLGNDVAAVAPTGFDVSPGTPTGCAGASPGTNLVKLTWTETVGTTVTYVASYRFVDQGAAKGILRVSCSGTGAGPYAGASSTKLGGALSATSPTVALISAGPETIGVSVTVTSAAGQPLTVRASTRNPADTLPTTTTSTLPTTACSILSINFPASMPNQGGNPGRLQADYDVEMDTTGACVGTTMSLQYDRLLDGSFTVTSFTFTGTRWGLELKRSNSLPWLDGDHSMVVLSNGSPIGTPYTFTIT